MSNIAEGQSSFDVMPDGRVVFQATCADGTQERLEVNPGAVAYLRQIRREVKTEA